MQWAAQWQRAHVLRLSHDVLLEIASLLDLASLLALRRVCRALSAITHENVLFVRLLVRYGPPIAPQLPIGPLSPEQRVISAHRLYKNWDLAALPVTVRTVRNDAIVTRIRRPVPQMVPLIAQPIAAPLPYHLPPGADAYPFLKLETYAPFRDPATKSSFGLAGPNPQAAPVHRIQTELGRSQPQSLERDAPGPTRQVPLSGNFAAATVRAWNTPPAPLNAYPNTPPRTSSPNTPTQPLPSTSSLPSTPNASRANPTPPPAPAPRPTHVASLSARAILAKIVGGGRWGVFVIKRQLKPDADKGKAKDDSSQQLTAEALATLGRPVDVKGKGKQRDPEQEMILMGEQRVKNWNVDPGGKSGEPLKVGDKSKSDEGVYLVVYDLDVIATDGGSDPERGKMAEFALKGTPSAMACRGTSRGVVVVIVRAVTGGATGTSLTTVFRWDYLASELTNLGTHKASCMLGAISIGEFETDTGSGGSAQTPGKRTLIAIVHRPRTIMIQDADTSHRCFVKLGKMPPLEHRHTLQTVHLLSGERILALRAIQGEQPSYVLEEHAMPAMGEMAAPSAPLQRQWIRNVDLQSCMLVEGPTYGRGALPDVSLWAFTAHPTRAVLHWLLRPTSVTSAESENDSMDVELGHGHPLPSVDSDIYSPTSTYAFPAQKICSSRISFPHHKVTLAPGARRALWFERPERSRSGEARGMRGVWGYTSVSVGEQVVRGVVRSCTSELPEDVLAAMENNTLGVAFDEASGRVVAITCGDGYSALTGSKVWVLDYA